MPEADEVELSKPLIHAHNNRNTPSAPVPGGSRAPRAPVAEANTPTEQVVNNHRYQLCYGRQTDAQRHADVPNQHAERRRVILDFEVILQFRSRLISLFL